MQPYNWDAMDKKYEYLRGQMGLLACPERHLSVLMRLKLYDVADEVADAIVTTAATNHVTRPEGYIEPHLLAEKLLGFYTCPYCSSFSATLRTDQRGGTIIEEEGEHDRRCLIPDWLPSESRGESEVWMAVMEVALWLAKLDPRYWGVTNPAEQNYCSNCRTGVPKDEFTYSDTKCDRHFRRKS